MEMSDADGIDASCGINYLQDGLVINERQNSQVSDLDGTGLWSSSWLLPSGLSGNLTVTISCVDNSDNFANYSSQVTVDNATECITDCLEVKQDSEKAAESYAIEIFALFSLLLLVVIVTIRVRAREGDEKNETWGVEDSPPESDTRIPEGWTLEEFLNWLDGPMPDEWEEDQWSLYRESLEDLRLT